MDMNMDKTTPEPIVEPRGMRCPRCGLGSRVTHTYVIGAGRTVERRRQCQDDGCRMVWKTSEERMPVRGDHAQI